MIRLNFGNVSVNRCTCEVCAPRALGFAAIFACLWPGMGPKDHSSGRGIGSWLSVWWNLFGGNPGMTILAGLTKRIGWNEIRKQQPLETCSWTRNAHHASWQRGGETPSKSLTDTEISSPDLGFAGLRNWDAWYGCWPNVSNSSSWSQHSMYKISPSFPDLILASGATTLTFWGKFHKTLGGFAGHSDLKT